MSTVDLTIRPARDDDDLDTLNAEDPYWGGSHSLRRLMLLGEQGSVVRVAERDGRLVGFARAVPYGVADGFRGMASVFVPSTERGQGVGNELWNAVWQVSAGRVRGIRVQHWPTGAVGDLFFDF